jgi:uncharacterized membrane protein YfcA
MAATHAALLLIGGLVAGVIGTAGGITSLVSYPVLLAVGIPPLAANVANGVALVACWPGSALASRPELRGRAAWLERWAPVTAVGGAGGALLLLSTPTAAFDRVVPFLVALGSLALLLQPKLAALRKDGAYPHPAYLFAGLLAVSVYNGYFGAGAGVMLLALCLHTVDRHLPTANALKNMLVGAACVVSALIFIIAGPVKWAAVIPLGVGMFAGSTLGPRVARRLPANVLRWLVAVLGLALAVKLWI